MRTLLFIAILGLFWACKPKPEVMESTKLKKEKTVWVNSHKVDRDLFLVQFSEKLSTQWDTVLCEFQDFKYFPGSLYKLSVSEVKEEQKVKTYIVNTVLEQRVDEKLQLYDIWALKAMPGYSGVDSVASRVYIELNTSDMSMSGQAHCNYVSTDIEVADGQTLRFSHIVQTKRACPMLAAETEFVNRLNATNSYSREGLTLHLKDKEGDIILSFKKID